MSRALSTLLLFAGLFGGLAGAASLDELLAQEARWVAQAQVDPTDAAVVRQLSAVRTEVGNALWRKGDLDGAIDYLANAVKFDPTHAERFERLADLLLYRPEPQAVFLAQSYYEDALALEPQRRGCRAKLAASYLETYEVLDAQRHLKVLVLNGGGTPDGLYVQSLVVTYLELGAAEAGYRFMTKRVGAGGDARFAVAQGVLLQAMGLKGTAKMILSAVAEGEQPALAAYARGLLKRYTREGAR
jgi:tetratricopeptide (TPR) repeat protein